MSEQIEALVRPQLLAWARTTAGLDVESAARKAQTKPGRLQAWEKGDARPTINQVRKLADVYKRPLAVFFLDEPPTEDVDLPDFRRFEAALEFPVSPELRLAIRKARLKRQTALELLHELGEKPRPFRETVKLSEDPEVIGQRIRQVLKLDRQPAISDAREFFNFRRAMIEKAGILVFQAEQVPIGEMRGFSISQRPLPVAVLNIKDAFAARSFSLFHELAHIFLERGGLCNFEEDTGDGAAQKIEIFCNHVAGATLVPAGALLSRPETPKTPVPSIPDDAISALAAHFGASAEVILRRLVTLKKVPRAFYLKKRGELQKRYAGLSKKKQGFAPPYLLAVATNGSVFTKLVLEAYSEERLGTADVLEYLAVRPKHIEKVKEAVYGKPSEQGV